ncbi:MAG TPA: aspartate kinase [Anaeromyxobacteraceae bacterium]|nr:aspartate kinase [Anaeromyxobacteraceae bacterium]
MPVVVQKFGGSSVADVEKLKRVAARIAARRRAGDEVCVVVSAMGDTTDELLGLAKQVAQDPPRRELDMLLTAGERISMALLSMALQELGVEAISFTGSQAGILTTDAHATARILEVRPVRVREELARGRVVIVAGFQGVSARREITTLGRGGSDTTAVALAAALGADCEIYSDVAGVFTADPRVVPEARRQEELSYEEMQELAQAGAKVLNAQAVEFAREKGIAIRARSTFGGPEETVIRAGRGPERIAGVAVERELALLTVPFGGLARAQELLAREGAPATEVALGTGRATLVVPLENVHGFAALVARLRAAVPGCEVAAEGIGAVAVVGTGAGASERVRREVEAALEALGARALAVATAPLRITAYVEARVLPEAARALHRRLIG